MKHSRFQSTDEMLAASGFKVDTAEDFAAIPDAEWDQFISQNTSFPSWEAMQGEAAQAWVARKLARG
jgi:hypothetical protein